MLTGRVCLITGGSRGIGKAIAQCFAQQGAVVYATATKLGSVEAWADEFNSTLKGEKSKQGLHETKELEDNVLAHGEVRSLYFDVADERAARDAIMQVKEECGHIDGLVNNAGVEFNELIGMISHANMEKMFSVNVYGTINMLQTVSRIMGRQPNGGSIVNIVSLTALRGNRGQMVYSATKGAVVSLTKSAAKELAGKKIRVNAIAPGLTNTDMMKQADPEKLQSRINNICMGRLAEPEDIAKACLFMVSDLSTYISGQVLAVDGCTIM